MKWFLCQCLYKIWDSDLVMELWISYSNYSFGTKLGTVLLRVLCWMLRLLIKTIWSYVLNLDKLNSAFYADSVFDSVKRLECV